METFKLLFNDLGENIDGMLNSSQQEIDKIKCEYEQFKSELMNEVKLLRVELKELREIINSFKKKSLGTENISVVIEDVTASEDEEESDKESDNADANTEEDDNADANTEVDADTESGSDVDTESGSDVDANEVDDADANTENDKENDKENDTESGSDVDANEGDDDDEVDADSDVDANTEGDKDDDTESDKENDKDDDTESDEGVEIKLIKKILKSHENKKIKRVYYVSDDSLGEIYECLADDEQGEKPIGKMKIHKGKPVPYYFK